MSGTRTPQDRDRRLVSSSRAFYFTVQGIPSKKVFRYPSCEQFCQFYSVLSGNAFLLPRGIIRKTDTTFLPSGKEQREPVTRTGLVFSRSLIIVMVSRLPGKPWQEKSLPDRRNRERLVPVKKR